MSILVQGMNMPEEPVAIIICPDSKVFRVSYPEQIAEAVPIPPHGRLIDADALEKQVKHDAIRSDVFMKFMCRYLENAPTIIPADPVEEGET